MIQFESPDLKALNNMIGLADSKPGISTYPYDPRGSNWNAHLEQAWCGRWDAKRTELSYARLPFYDILAGHMSRYPS
ncbi:hypothetical protein DSO57_1032430 [Entomophthora muscae]|uniref:Uncharacterized protein n=1 Tax=Entomophthora muscae TaxID=34485 RepID=A0ACC2UL13_9FUNG|nr:hypothetical protein DSO57_1032430 [Entomophthora muscae]